MNPARIALHCIVACIVLAAVGLAVFYVDLVLRRSNYDIDKLLQNILLIATTAGAAITTCYSLSNNHLSWLTYNNALRPNVLIRVTHVNNPTNYPQTAIIYENKSNNTMYDLNIYLDFHCGSKIFDLSDLFPRNMLLPSNDSRTRTFFTFDELKKKGLDMTGIDLHLNMILKISYTYSWLGRTTNRNKLQDYKFSCEDKMWHLA